jgi:CRP-like cAMP-binding protein
VREFYLGEAGEEHTRAFIEAGQMTGSLLDLLSGLPAVTCVQALEATSTVAWRYRDFEAQAERFPELQRLARRHAERLYVKKTRREHEMLALPAAERYARFREENPALDARVSQWQVASYLGITPEHLSRLRRAAPARGQMPQPGAAGPRRKG